MALLPRGRIETGAPPAPLLAGEAAMELAARLPEIVLAAERASRTVAAGLHGRRTSGPGEAFWQFRPFQGGEPASRVDWRRSARDDGLYVREREWEAARTLWVWASLGPDMRYRSPLGATPKVDRALVIALGLAELVAEGGERAGWIGLTHPRGGRRVAQALGEHLAEALARGTELDGPSAQPLPRLTQGLLVSDWLGPWDAIETRLRALASDGARGHCVMVLDPIEESFPFRGRTEFTGLGNALRLTVGRAQALADDYARVLAERKDMLRTLTARIGWSFHVHHTDASAASVMLSLHALMTQGAR